MLSRDAEDFARRLGENVRRVRKLADLSQGELGFRAGIHHTEVSCIETGKRVSRVDTLVKLSAALSEPIGTFIEGCEWEPPPEARRGRFQFREVGQ